MTIQTTPVEQNLPGTPGGAKGHNPRIPDLAGFEKYNDIPLCAVGEDGDLVALGHYDPAEVFAAFVAYDDYLASATPDAVWATWAVNLTNGCPPGICPKYADSKEADPRTDQITGCSQCAEIREDIKAGGWCLLWGDEVAKLAPGAFPVMVLPR